MKQNKWIVKILLAGFILMFQSGIYAADKKWSVGVSVGASETDQSGKAVDNSFSSSGFTTTTNFDDTDFSINAFAGYRYSINVGFEVGYTNFGEFAYNGTETSVSYTGNSEVTGFYGAIVGFFPLSETLTMYGKFGYASWDEDVNISAASMQSAAYVSGKDGTDILFGFGLNYGLTDSFSIRGDLMQLKAPENIHMWSIGVAYHF